LKRRSRKSKASFGCGSPEGAYGPTRKKIERRDKLKKEGRRFDLPKWTPKGGHEKKQKKKTPAWAVRKTKMIRNGRLVSWRKKRGACS